MAEKTTDEWARTLRELMSVDVDRLPAQQRTKMNKLIETVIQALDTQIHDEAASLNGPKSATIPVRKEDQ